MRVRAVEERIKVERTFHALPSLRVAFAAGRVSYEQVRWIARVATEATAESWIRKAGAMSCIALQREVLAGDEAREHAAGVLRLTVPTEIAGIFAGVSEALRVHLRRWLSPSECLSLISRNFLARWGTEARRRLQRMGKVLRRDRAMCQVPGCSRGAEDRHHIVPRSRGGDDDPGNLISLCKVHHLHGVHAGYVLVTGRVPALRWVVGEREVAAELARRGGDPLELLIVPAQGAGDPAGAAAS
jgi:5-methylcytosine-specific restriction endonuclease McrA